MATPGQLITRLSEILTVPAETITVFDRVLKDAGLLTKGGRGRSAPHRTALDTARILIALLSTASPARAAEATADFCSLVELDEAPTAGRADLPSLHTVCRLQHGHTLEAAIAALLDTLGDPADREAIEAQTPAPLRIDVEQTGVEAIIILNGHIHHYLHPAALAAEGLPLPKAGTDAAGWIAADDQWATVRARHRGIQTTRTITYRKLAEIAATIADRAPHA